MRIALLLPGFSASETDWCIPYIFNLVRELALRHEVWVYALRYPGVSGSYSVCGARVHAFGGGQQRGIRQLPLLIRALTRVVRDGRKHRFSLIHGLFATDMGALATLAGQLLRIPVLITPLGGELVGLPKIDYGGQLRGPGRWLIHRAVTEATALTAISGVIRRQLEEYPCRRPIYSIPVGVDESLFCPGEGSNLEAGKAGSPKTEVSGIEAGPGSRPRLLSVGSLVPVKGFEVLFEAFNRIVTRLPQAHLDLVGEGPLQRDLQAQSRRLGLESQLTFHGQIPHEELPGFYRAADLLLVSSYYESASLVSLEALACGTPVVGTAVGHLPEIGAGLRTVPPGDADALARAALDLLNDREELKKLQHSGREVVLQRYRIHSIAEQLGRLYKELAAGQINS